MSCEFVPAAEVLKAPPRLALRRSQRQSLERNRYLECSRGSPGRSEIPCRELQEQLRWPRLRFHLRSESALKPAAGLEPATRIRRHSLIREKDALAVLVRRSSPKAVPILARPALVPHWPWHVRESRW